MKNWLHDLFIKEAKPALSKYDGINVGHNIFLLNEHIDELKDENIVKHNRIVDLAYIATQCRNAVEVQTLDCILNSSSLSNTFNGCASLTTIPKLDTSNVTNMTQMFYGCSSLTTIPQLDTGKVTSMSNMFYRCSNLTAIPQLDTSNVTDMRQMFYRCSNLTAIPQLDTSNVTDMQQMFYTCPNLTTIPQLDTSKVTSMYGMFYGCSSLTTIPQLDTSKVTDMLSMFRDCSSLTAIPQLDTGNATDMGYMFSGCSSLTTIPQLDTGKVTSMSNMFNNCSNLTECWLRNIKTRLSVNSSPKLTPESLIHLIYELRDTGSTKTFTIGSTNLAKLSNIYVKTIDITDEMRAEDDLVDEKLPFVQCESTDEGAMLITDYVTQKNWTIV